MVPTVETDLFGIDVVKALERLDDKVDDDGRWELWDALLLFSGKFNWKTVAAGEVESPVVLPGIQAYNTSKIITTNVILCSLQYMFSLSFELENRKCMINLTRN